MHIRAKAIENIPENTRRKRAGVQPQERARPGLVKLSPVPVSSPASSNSAPASSRSVSASQDAEYGETTTWARCRSLTSEYPVEAMVRLRAPTKFREPSARVEGP